jgi:hypothetical protein
VSNLGEYHALPLCDCPHSVRSVLSIARGQYKEPELRRSYLHPTALARIEQIGQSHGVTESLGIAVLSRGHSYGVAALFQQSARACSLLSDHVMPSSCKRE